jgi:cobalt/nickel transport system ATP-binding protein
VSAPAAIDIAGLNYRYSRGAAVLENISFTVQPGESVGVIGPNGAGKTTLFLCLAGVLVPRVSAFSVAGLDLTQAGQRRRLPEKLGIVFQNSDDQLFNATVFDDVAFGPLNLGLAEEEVRRRVAEALAQVGMSGCEERVPFHLSGGEKRRVALAGVLAMRPEVLLLDEPSLYLDPRGRRELITLINALDGTKLIASHDLELVLKTCTRVVLLDGGRLLGDGPARTLLADAELMEAHGLEVPASLLK